MARGKVVYKQDGPKKWRATVVGSNGKKVVWGSGWNSLRIARRGVAAAAKIILQGREEIREQKK